MISKELYNLVIKADKQAENGSGCNTCFCSIFKSRLQDSNLKHFLDWKAENKGFTSCGSILFYLQDLGIIEILSGVPGAEYDNLNRRYGVECGKLKIKLCNNPFKYNKI